MVDTKKLSELLDWYFEAVDSLVSVVVADRDGLLLAAKDKSGSIELDSEKVGGLSALVEPTLKRIAMPAACFCRLWFCLVPGLYGA